MEPKAQVTWEGERGTRGRGWWCARTTRRLPAPAATQGAWMVWGSALLTVLHDGQPRIKATHGKQVGSSAAHDLVPCGRVGVVHSNTHVAQLPAQRQLGRSWNAAALVCCLCGCGVPHARSQTALQPLSSPDSSADGFLPHFIIP